MEDYFDQQPDEDGEALDEFYTAICQYQAERAIDAGVSPDEMDCLSPTVPQLMHTELDRRAETDWRRRTAPTCDPSTDAASYQLHRDSDDDPSAGAALAVTESTQADGRDPNSSSAAHSAPIIPPQSYYAPPSASVSHTPTPPNTPRLPAPCPPLAPASGLEHWMPNGMTMTQGFNLNDFNCLVPENAQEAMLASLTEDGADMDPTAAAHSSAAAASSSSSAAILSLVPQSFAPAAHVSLPLGMASPEAPAVYHGANSVGNDDTDNDPMLSPPSKKARVNTTESSSSSAAAAASSQTQPAPKREDCTDYDPEPGYRPLHDPLAIRRRPDFMREVLWRVGKTWEAVAPGTPVVGYIRQTTEDSSKLSTQETIIRITWGYFKRLQAATGNPIPEVELHEIKAERGKAGYRPGQSVAPDPAIQVRNWLLSLAPGTVVIMTAADRLTRSPEIARDYAQLAASKNVRFLTCIDAPPVDTSSIGTDALVRFDHFEVTVRRSQQRIIEAILRWQLGRLFHEPGDAVPSKAISLRRELNMAQMIANLRFKHEPGDAVPSKAISLRRELNMAQMIANLRFKLRHTQDKKTSALQLFDSEHIVAHFETQTQTQRELMREQSLIEPKKQPIAYHLPPPPPRKPEKQPIAHVHRPPPPPPPQQNPPTIDEEVSRLETTLAAERDAHRQLKAEMRHRLLAIYTQANIARRSPAAHALLVDRMTNNLIDCVNLLDD